MVTALYEASLQAKESLFIPCFTSGFHRSVNEILAFLGCYTALIGI